jgi:hypothetical protein
MIRSLPRSRTVPSVMRASHAAAMLARPSSRREKRRRSGKASWTMPAGVKRAAVSALLGNASCSLRRRPRPVLDRAARSGERLPVRSVSTARTPDGSARLTPRACKFVSSFCESRSHAHKIESLKRATAERPHAEATTGTTEKARVLRATRGLSTVTGGAGVSEKQSAAAAPSRAPVVDPDLEY